MATITIQCPLCAADLELELEWEEGDPNYGADADGNRGISVPGYWYLADEIPTSCPDCTAVYPPDMVADLEPKIERAVERYNDSYDPMDRYTDYYNDY